jgi:hypothetical protein
VVLPLSLFLRLSSVRLAGLLVILLILSGWMAELISALFVGGSFEIAVLIASNPLLRLSIAFVLFVVLPISLN